jgi:hypothetical protein
MLPVYAAGFSWQQPAASPCGHLIQPSFGVAMKHHVVIEDWEGDGAIRLPHDVLQEMGVDVGSTLYLLEEYVGTTRCLVLSKTPRIPDRVDELVGHWESFGKIASDLGSKDG